MTTQEIKKSIAEEIAKVNNRKGDKSRSYKLGKLSGMLKAFRIAGLITPEEHHDIFEDIVNEYF